MPIAIAFRTFVLKGLSSDAAADTILYLLTEARRRRLSGVGLKDERLLILPERLNFPSGSAQKQ